MKKIKQLLLASSIAMVTFTSCKKTPATAFASSKTAAQTGEPVTFTNSTKDGVTYKWDFGDGTTSTEASPVHAFSKVGTFSVKLTAYSKKEKKSDEATSSVTITDARDNYIGVYSGFQTLTLAGKAELDTVDYEYVTKSTLYADRIMLGEDIYAVVSYTNLTVPAQTVTNSDGDINITSGSGTLTGAKLKYNLVASTTSEGYTFPITLTADLTKK